MVSKAFRLSPQAELDLESIWLYTFENWSRAQADRYHRSLMAEIEELAAGRRKGRPSTIRANIMKRQVGAHVIWFRDLADGLDIIRVLHGAQDVERNLHD